MGPHLLACPTADGRQTRGAANDNMAAHPLLRPARVRSWCSFRTGGALVQISRG
jgi:hypothetical protein